MARPAFSAVSPTALILPSSILNDLAISPQNRNLTMAFLSAPAYLWNNRVFVYHMVGKVGLLGFS